ncbi:class I SAM-dependent methyltransferase [Luteolibacter ambystomatis]|uniref:Class I SAM-dependent methyltransferase n=1 Tax=Luteolibacter ambystomatis TaxID=2824561 RepID=A0A975J0W8_9BACT|nr:class I SAM-dependent methyltransferase [Luteolibacter ambystomatis]QUE51988.1 class I SAM-dependent methyltransferase [Luteolibacter ambystomatis]
MQPRIPFRFPGIAADVERLRVKLREALSLSGSVASSPAAVLNLACGRADETGTLFAALAPARIGYYLGIDLLPGDIAEAAKRWQPETPDTRIEFRAGDASRTDRMRELPPFDLVFIRHQNYWHDAPVWDRLLQNALAALKPGGVLAITSYFDREHELALTSLKLRGAELLANLRHTESRTLDDAPNKSVDRHLAILRR